LAYLGCVLVILGIFLPMLLTVISPSELTESIFIIAWYCVGGFSVVAGFWVLGTPDPRESPHTPGRGIRRLCRVGPPAIVLMMALSMTAATWFPKLEFAVWCLVRWAWLAWVLLVSLHIRRLSDRLPAKPVRTRSRMVLGALVVLLTADCLVACLSPLAVPGFLGTLPVLLLLASSIRLLAIVILAFAMLSLIDKCHRAFRKAGEEALLNWSVAQPPLETSEDTP